ncbi:hypothetical protein UACE39S_04533 [Ureibacillus acetophenoni]
MNLSMSSGAKETNSNADAHIRSRQSLSKGLLMGAEVTLELFYLNCSVGLVNISKS